jgi:hypothetical protein
MEPGTTYLIPLGIVPHHTPDLSQINPRSVSQLTFKSGVLVWARVPAIS